jgi:type IV pilus assembly protein PilW
MLRRPSPCRFSPDAMRTATLRSRGFSLVEMMVSMAMGIFLVGGALTVYVQGRATHSVNEKLAQLQDNGRLALDIVARDAMLGDFWARTEDSNAIAGRTGDVANPMPPGFAPAADCYPGYYTNVEIGVDAANDDQVGADNPFTACIADDVRADGTDVLVVRHVDETETPRADIVGTRLYMISSSVSGTLFVGSQGVPAGYAADDPVHEVVTNAYYVGPSSTAGDDVPSLRRMTLAAGPAIVDEELVPGVEDVQVQLGIDTDGDSSVNSYLNPGSPALAGASVVAARLWLRLRAEDAELSFTDDAKYEYAGRSFQPNDGLRRLVVSKTIHLRNRRAQG